MKLTETGLKGLRARVKASGGADAGAVAGGFGGVPAWHCEAPCVFKWSVLGAVAAAGSPIRRGRAGRVRSLATKAVP